MGNIASNVVSLLQYLLPGFLSAWVFYGFTSFQKPSQFERVVQALIFTLFVKILVFSSGIGRHWGSNQWNSDVELAASVVIAVCLGFVFVYFANTDRFHSLIRKFGISKETSYPSEWFYGHSAHACIILHLIDKRKIYGWPKEWPTSHEKGYFLLKQAAWLDENKEIPLNEVETILIAAKDVKMIEFMKKPERVNLPRRPKKGQFNRDLSIIGVNPDPPPLKYRPAPPPAPPRPPKD